MNTNMNTYNAMTETYSPVEDTNININYIQGNENTPLEYEENNVNINMNMNENTYTTNTEGYPPTNYAIDNGFNQNDINFNISFSFGQKQKNNRKNPESIEILHEFISNEEKIKEINRINDDVNKIERIKKGDMKIEIKMNLDKIEKNIDIYFKRPFMRKNYENDKIFKNIINEDVKEEKKINISDEIKKNDVANEININNYNEI